MEELAAHVLDALREQRLEPEPLARAGAADPPGDARALTHAARHPDLVGQLELWVPALLRSARPGFAAQQLVSIATRRREIEGEPLAVANHPLLPRLLGTSNFLARWLTREPSWLEDLTGALPPAPECGPAADFDALRRAKYRGLLRIATRDMAGRPFDRGLGELSELADASLVSALRLSTPDGVKAPALLALGKLGGSELNFSSDVDLIFVCDTPPDERGHSTRVAASRVVQEFKRRLEERRSDGFGYRVDLDLRPEGPAGALVRSVDATLAYYESRGAEWERQMLLRLRPLAGDPRAAADFVAGIAPFVYRRSIGPEVVGSVRDMKARIESERREAGRDIDADLKEGPGGIRDVEFTVQALQLFHAGRNPALRTGNVLDALALLEAHAILPVDAARSLRDDYLWLRRAEHALQVAEEKQTARVPRDPTEQTALARRIGYDEPEGRAAREHWLDDWECVRGRVRGHFEDLVLGERR